MGLYEQMDWAYRSSAYQSDGDRQCIGVVGLLEAFPSLSINCDPMCTRD